jgi:hypothetical protein
LQTTTANQKWCNLRKLIFGLFLLSLVGCATHSSKFAPIAADLAADNIDQALEILDQENPPERDLLLWLMNRGMLLRLQGDFTTSNQEFTAAKQLVEELDALSLREQTLALTINDTTRSYAGDPYEQVLLNVYSALNYLDLGQPDDARVEILQVDLRLAALADKEIGALSETDPFARYLSGIIYEQGGEYSDAMIAYRSAYQAYQKHGEHYSLDVPQSLKVDLLRSSERLDLTEENHRYQELFGISHWQAAETLQQQGELIFLFHNGLAPVKIEKSATFPIIGQGQIVRIALPEYLRRRPGFSSARLRINDHVIETTRVENIEELAIAELARNMPVIITRTVARAALKYQTSHEVGKQNGLAGLALNITGLLTERADTRSWQSLPADIQLARVPLKPGEYDLDVELRDMSGQVVRRLNYPAVTLRAGKKTFLSCHRIATTSLLRRK